MTATRDELEHAVAWRERVEPHLVVALGVAEIALDLCPAAIERAKLRRAVNELRATLREVETNLSVGRGRLRREP